MTPLQEEILRISNETFEERKRQFMVKVKNLIEDGKKFAEASPDKQEKDYFECWQHDIEELVWFDEL